MGNILDFSPEPVTRNYARETRRTLEAQLGLAPQVYQANAQFQPLYNALNLQNMDDFLTGTDAMSYDTMAWQRPVYRNTLTGRENGGGMSLVPGMPGGLPGLPGGSGGIDFPGLPGGGGGFPGLPGMDGGGLPGLDGLFGDDDEDKPRRRLVSPGRYVSSGTAVRPAQRGFLDILENSIMPSMLRQQSAQRESELADVLNLGPQAREAFRSANPEAASILDALYSDAMSGMDSGADLNPAETRNLQQSVRAGQADRGMGLGPMDSFEEALSSLDYGRGLRNERRAFAMDVLGREQDFYGDPLSVILGRSSTVGQAPGIGANATAASRMGNMFNPESGYAGSVYDFNANAQQSANNIEASNNAAMVSAIISAIGNMAGGAGGMAFCWVAREVFGAECMGGVEKWKLFRHWMFTRAPLGFVLWYARNGPAVAEWLRGREAVKARLRQWMDVRILEVCHGV